MDAFLWVLAGAGQVLVLLYVYQKGYNAGWNDVINQLKMATKKETK